MQGNARGSTRPVAWMLATAAVAANSMPVAVMAQAQGAAPQSARGFRLEEVTVTARRRAENQQDAPVSMLAFSGDTLAQRQVFSTDDLSNVTANLQFGTIAPLAGNNAAAQVFIRGIGQSDPTAGVDPGVGIYIDDVYLGSAVGGVMDLNDIAGVQVLRGPQGTLFGRNTIGGAVLISTREPGDIFGGSLRVGLGSDHLREAFGAVDLPVSDTIKTRWTIASRTRNGYVRRAVDGTDLGDVDRYSITGKATWRFNDTLRWSFKGDYARASEHGTPLVFAAIDGAQDFPRAVSLHAGCPGMTSMAMPVPDVDDPRCANSYWNDGPFVANGTFPLNSFLENWGAALVGELDTATALDFKSITSYRELDWAGSRDADNTPFPILHTAYRSVGSQFSQEVQALWQSAALDGVVGLFYYKQRTHDEGRVTLSPPPLPTGTTDHIESRWDNYNWAAFTQWSWEAAQGLNLAAGVRYTSETKRILPDQYNQDRPSMLYLPRQWFEQDFSATTGSAAIQYRWNPTAMTYLSWSQGFKSGGMNSRFSGVVAAGRPPAFASEKADSREIGAKFDLPAGMRLNVALFSTKYHNLQFIYRVGTLPLLFNAGKASIDGAEFELQFVPGSSWSIEAGAGYLDAKIDRIETIVFDGMPTTTAVTTNSRLPRTPQWMANAAVSYAAYFGTMALTPRIDVAYTAAQFFDAANTTEIAQNDAVTLVNVGLTLAGKNARWQLSLGVRNLTDEIHPIAGNSSLSTSTGYAEIAYNRGREAFASITVRTGSS